MIIIGEIAALQSELYTIRYTPACTANAFALRDRTGAVAVSIQSYIFRSHSNEESKTCYNEVTGLHSKHSLRRSRTLVNTW